MKLTVKKLSLAACLALLTATAQAKLNVVATLPDYGAIAGEVGGEKVKITIYRARHGRPALR